MWVFSFPNPVNEIAARVVAAGVVVMSLAVLVFDAHWILIPLVFGFAARVHGRPPVQPPRPAGHPGGGPPVGAAPAGGRSSQTVRPGHRAGLLVHAR